MGPSTFSLIALLELRPRARSDSRALRSTERGYSDAGRQSRV